MPGTRTTQNVGPVLGSCYPVDVALVADEVNLWERNAKLIVYKRTQGQGKFEAVISDAEGNEHDVIVGATAAVAHASRHTLNEPKPKDTPQTSNDTKGPSAEATPKKNNTGNRFDALCDEEESAVASPDAASYSAPRSSARLSEQRRVEVEMMSKAANAWATHKAKSAIRRLREECPRLPCRGGCSCEADRRVCERVRCRPPSASAEG